LRSPWPTAKGIVEEVEHVQDNIRALVVAELGATLR